MAAWARAMSSLSQSGDVRGIGITRSLRPDSRRVMNPFHRGSFELLGPAARDSKARPGLMVAGHSVWGPKSGLLLDVLGQRRLLAGFLLGR